MIHLEVLRERARDAVVLIAHPLARRTSALLHRAAAEVEELTPSDRGWVVGVEGNVLRIELLDGTDEETEAAVRLLRSVARKLEATCGTASQEGGRS